MKADRRLQEELLLDLLSTAESESLSARGIHRIDKLVCGGRHVRRRYIEYLQLLSDLRFGLAANGWNEMLRGVCLGANRERGLQGCAGVGPQ
jgi:hypothetical protein